MYCEKCGNKLDENWKVCPNCGSSVGHINNNQEINKTNKLSLFKNKKLIVIISIVAFIFILALFGSGETNNNGDSVESKQPIDDEVIKESNLPTEETVDKSELAGTYLDSELNEKLVIYENNGKASYCLLDCNGNITTSEFLCTIDSNCIVGTYYYIAKNIDGSFCLSSGVGEPWGNYEKISNVPEVDLSSGPQLTYDLYTDVENRALYKGNNGKVVDINGNEITEYSYLYILDNGMVSDGENIAEGLCVSENGQIELIIPEESSDSAKTEQIELASGHYTNPDSPIIFTIDNSLYSDGESEMFVYIKIYYGTLDDMYAREYTGMINLFNKGSVTVQSGLQSAYYFDYAEGVIEGSGLSMIAENYCYDLKIKYDKNASDSYYLDNDLSDAIAYADKQIDYESLYEDIINDVIERNGRSRNYIMHDLNKDGYNELFIDSIALKNDADGNSGIEVYTTDGTNAFYIGEIAGRGATYFYEDLNDKGIYYSIEGGENNKIYHITYENSLFNKELVYDSPLSVSNYTGIGECINKNYLPEGFFW